MSWARSILVPPSGDTRRSTRSARPCLASLERGRSWAVAALCRSSVGYVVVGLSRTVDGGSIRGIGSKSMPFSCARFDVVLGEAASRCVFQSVCSIIRWSGFVRSVPRCLDKRIPGELFRARVFGVDGAVRLGASAVG